MKILEVPVDTVIRCECGCKFEFEPGDVEVTVSYADSDVLKHYHVECPFCNEKHYLYPDQEKIKEDNETQRHCADCRYFETIIYRDELTREWITLFRCKKDGNPVAVDANPCDYFVRKEIRHE